MNKQLQEDLAYTYGKLSAEERRKLKDATLLLTGGAGFLGFYLMQFFSTFREELGIRKVLCLDNFLLGEPDWLSRLQQDPQIKTQKFDIIRDRLEELPGAEEADYLIHMASIASPTFYRKYPIETVDANIWGLRRLLDFYKERDIKGLLFFSSSELYGDPAPEAVPIREDYNGNVCATGPRACYDESKRFGETLCMLFAQEYGMPIGVVRPFNNYGPGMKLTDKRVPADFAKNVLDNQDLTILSSGAPTRTFCHIADAAAGYLKVLVHGNYDFFNIGIEGPEITISRLAEYYQEAGQELLGYTGAVGYAVSEEADYLTNNPQRRCPNLEKARSLLGYAPEIQVQEGVRRFLQYLKEDREGEGLW